MGEQKKDYMMKRAMNKSTFISASNYKNRWFVLDDRDLKYFEGTLDKQGKQKGGVELRKIKAVETVEDNVLDNKINVFQVVHASQKNNEILTLYIVAQDDIQRQDWVTKLRKAAENADATFIPKYHKGVWISGNYTCCNQISKNAIGCEVTSTEREFGGTPSGLPPPPSIPAPSPEPTPKKIFVAVYNFTPTEEEDLELLQMHHGSWELPINGGTQQSSSFHSTARILLTSPDKADKLQAIFVLGFFLFLSNT